MANTRALNCKLKTTGDQGSAGLGAGKVVNGCVTDTTAVNCQVETFGAVNSFGANAAIGVGFILGKGGSVVDRTTALNCTIKTNDEFGEAGIGAGAAYGGTVTNSTAVNCQIKTFGVDAYAGIGTGFVASGATVANTLVANSTVTTTGRETNAGIGAGEFIEGSTVTNTTVVNSRVEALGLDAIAGIVSSHAQVCNTYINDERLDDSPGVCPLDNVCERVAHPLLTPDCHPDSEYLDRLGKPGSFSSDFFSVETLNTESAPTTTMAPFQKTVPTIPDTTYQVPPYQALPYQAPP